MSDVSMARMFEKHPIFSNFVFLPLMLLNEHAPWLLKLLVLCGIGLFFAAIVSLSWYLYPDTVVAIFSCITVVLLGVILFYRHWLKVEQLESEDQRQHIYTLRLRCQKYEGPFTEGKFRKKSRGFKAAEVFDADI